MSLAGRGVPFFCARRATVFRRFLLTIRETTIHPIETTMSSTDATVSSGSCTNSSRGWT